jgi:hypothetical protein
MLDIENELKGVMVFGFTCAVGASILMVLSKLFNKGDL